MDIAHFLPAARSVISLAHSDANVNVSSYTPLICRLTGGWERFLLDTLHVQYSVFASSWNAVSPAMLSPIDACQELGALIASPCTTRCCGTQRGSVFCEIRHAYKSYRR